MAQKENYKSKTSARFRRNKTKCKQKEQGFVLNCVNFAQSKLPTYDSTTDKYLKYFFIRTSADRFAHSKRKHQHRSKFSQIQSSQRKLTLPVIRAEGQLSKQEFDDFLNNKFSQLHIAR